MNAKTIFFLVLLFLPICLTFSWSNWSKWPMSCSVTCGVGRRCRKRVCVDGFGKEKTPDLCLIGTFNSTECIKCVVSTRCPRTPGWSVWGEWSQCTISDSDTRKKNETKDGCILGTTWRKRVCNNPPPDPGDASILCSGLHQQLKRCQFDCQDLPTLDDYNLKARVSQQITSDHLHLRVNRKSFLAHLDAVIFRAPGEFVAFDCNTQAYNLTKELVEAKIISAQRLGIPSSQLIVTWKHGGNDVTNENYFQSHAKTSESSLASEESRFHSQFLYSKKYVKGTQLTILRVKPCDTGVYTCELSVGRLRWAAIFYSLIVTGLQVTGSSLLPFYLHSSLGLNSPLLSRDLYWYDAARLMWTLNGEKQFTDLMIRSRSRIKYIKLLNYTHQGYWNCYLIVQLPNSPTVQASMNDTISSLFLINAFFLKVTLKPSSLWELAEQPVSTAHMRIISIISTTLCFVLVISVGLTIWAVNRWVKRTPQLPQMQACVEEVIDDQTRLFLFARHRTVRNRQMLLPLITQEEIAIDLERKEEQNQ